MVVDVAAVEDLSPSRLADLPPGIPVEREEGMVVGREMDLLLDGAGNALIDEGAGICDARFANLDRVPLLLLFDDPPPLLFAVGR